MPKVVDHAARRWDICAAAAQRIAAGGLEAATIRDIAAASGHSKGVIEHYFDGKEELISGALEWANRRYERRVEKATDDLVGLASLRQRITATLPVRESERDEWKVRLVFWSMAAIDAKLRKQQSQRFQRAIDYFEEDLRTAQLRGELTLREDVSLAARHLVNMTTGICIAALHNPRLYNRNELQVEVENIIQQLNVDAASIRRAR